ncbi:hypothetical protein Tco_1561349 [Tanacetum coccineum]
MVQKSVVATMKTLSVDESRDEISRTQNPDVVDHLSKEFEQKRQNFNDDARAIIGINSGHIYSIKYVLRQSTIDTAVQTTRNLSAAGIVFLMDHFIIGLQLNPVPINLPGIIIPSANNSKSKLAMILGVCVVTSLGGMELAREFPTHLGENNALFSLKVHYAGMFTNPPNRSYVNGDFCCFVCIDIGEFSVLEVSDMVNKLVYNDKVTMFYHFKKSGCDLDNGLHTLRNDSDVLALGEYVRLGSRVIDVYVEHHSSTLDTFYQS